MAVWTIKAEYDPEAQVWYTVKGDMPALIAEGATVDLLAKKAGGMLLDLLEINADILTPAQLAGPHTIRIVAHDGRALEVAA